jgi:hypothetical protein
LPFFFDHQMYVPGNLVIRCTPASSCNAAHMYLETQSLLLGTRLKCSLPTACETLALKIAGMSNVRGLDDILGGGKGGDDDKKFNEYYAGGEKRCRLYRLARCLEDCSQPCR